jgi:hypothetical protein
MMKSKLFLLMFFFVASVYGQNAIINGSGLISVLELVRTTPESVDPDNSLIGIWVIDTTIVKQTIDSVSVITGYPFGDTATTYLKRPWKMTFTADTVIFNDITHGELCAYSINGNNILVDFITHGGAYQYSIDESGRIQFVRNIGYWGHEGDTMFWIEEEYTFKGRAEE